MGRVKSKDRIRSRSLGSIFSWHVIMMMLGFIAWAVIAFIIFNLLINTNVIYPSNYVELQISKTYEKLISAESITPDMIPDACKYMVFKEDGSVVSGNMSDESAGVAWNVVLTGAKSGD